MQEVPVLQALLQFVRFGLPWDFGRTITIAHGEARPVVSPPLSSPVFQRQQWSHEKLRGTGSPVQAGRAYEETYGGELDCGHPSRRPPEAGPQDEGRVCGNINADGCSLASSCEGREAVVSKDEALAQAPLRRHMR